MLRLTSILLLACSLCIWLYVWTGVTPIFQMQFEQYVGISLPPILIGALIARYVRRKKRRDGLPKRYVQSAIDYGRGNE